MRGQTKNFESSQTQKMLLRASNMNPTLNRALQIHQLVTAALFLITLISAGLLNALPIKQPTNAETKHPLSNSGPFHLSWTSRDSHSRYDFVFNFNRTLENLIKLDSDPSNFLTNSLKGCTNSSACLFTNGTQLELFESNNGTIHKSSFKSNRNFTRTASSPSSCDTIDLKITHYCSTHWNPPTYLHSFNCSHFVEWHSPITCNSSSTNHERSCYIYDPSGKLIDLTPKILSNGSSYEIHTGNSTHLKKFNVNICNEAHDKCGPNVSACFTDQSGLVESGYNNLTSIEYDSKDQATLLTYLGHFKEQCVDSRIKTVIRFICRSKAMVNIEPRLVRSTNCENIIDWPSVHACPVADIKVPEINCIIHYPPLGIDIDIKKLTNNRTQIEVPGVKLGGQDKKMIIGICQAIPKTYECGGKINSNTKACLIDAHDNSTVKSANNSMIVGSFSNSFIQLSDKRIFLESYAVNRTCSEQVRPGFNVTQQVGTKIEFFCSKEAQEIPTFLGYDDCTYVFEWGSPLLCAEGMSNLASSDGFTQVLPSNQATKHLDETKQEVVIKNDTQIVEPKRKEIITPETVEATQKNTQVPKSSSGPQRIGSFHKFFMISLIVMSLAAFIVIIFVLDKKTRLRVKMRQARQVFQSNNQQPYSRVIDDLDL